MENAAVNALSQKPHSIKRAIAAKIPHHLPAILLLGALSQIAQILLLRELLMVFQGNELFIGLILAAWMLWVGVGSYLGAVLVERTKKLFLWTVLTAAGVLLMLPLTIFLIRQLRGFFAILPGVQLSLADAAVSCLLLMAPVCILMGIQFVLLSKVWREKDQTADTSGAGKTYVGEAVGGALGGTVFTLFMVRFLNPFQSAVFTASLMLAATLLILWNSCKKTEFKRFRMLLFALLLPAVFSFPFLEQLDALAYKIQWLHFAPQHRLVDTHPSRYGTIAVLQLEDQFSFFQSGHLVFSISGPEADAPGLEEREAVSFAHFAMSQHKNPSQVLLIGGGIRGTLGEMLKHPVEKLRYIEQDEVLTEATRPHLSSATTAALADPRVSLIHTDGRLFVRTTQEKYDLIIVDVPDPATAALNRYYTEEFFREASARLNPGGVLVIGATSTPGLRGTPIANRNATLYHTLSAVFDHVMLAGERFMFFFATNTPGQISLDPLILQERFQERNIETDGFSPQYFQVILQQSQLQRVNWMIRHHGRNPYAHLEGPLLSPLLPGTIEQQEQAEKRLPAVADRYFINSDLRPIAYYYTLMFLDELTRAGSGELFQFLLRVEFWWLLLLFCFPLLTASAKRIFSRHGNKSSLPRFAILFSVFCTGFSTMTLQIALLFSFQSIYGFIYEMIGLITALFMCGLALGAFISNRYIKKKKNMDALAMVQLSIALLAILIAILLPQTTKIHSPAGIFALFSLLTFAAGLLNGIDFPLSAACFMALKNKAEKSAGTVYGMELFGACIGAILASAVVAPILGIISCALLAAVANGSAFLVLLMVRRIYLCTKTTTPIQN